MILIDGGGEIIKTNSTKDGNSTLELIDILK